MPETPEPRTHKTVETAIDIIEALERLDGAGVTELAEHLGMSTSTCYTYLATLKKRKYLVKDGDSYQLSLRFLTKGRYIRQQTDLYLAGKEETEKLAEETGEYTHLMAEEYGRGIYLQKAVGAEAVGKEYHSQFLNKADFLHYPSAGKAVLAHISPERVDRIIEEHGLPKQTDETICTRSELLEELEQIRERGFALSDEEEVRGLRAVGAPITDETGTAIGAISITGPVSRFSGETFTEELPQLVMQTAGIIELNLSYREKSEC